MIDLIGPGKSRHCQTWMTLHSETLGTFVPWQVTFFWQNLQNLNLEGWTLTFEESLADKVDIYKRIARRFKTRCEGQIHARGNRHRRYWHFDVWHLTFDIWHPWSVIFLKVGGMSFLKQCLQALLPAPSPISYQTPLVTRPLFDRPHWLRASAYEQASG